MQTPSEVTHVAERTKSVIDTDFLNALLCTGVALFCILRVVAWAVAESHGSRLSSDVSVGMLVGGWESHPERSPTASVQKFMGAERVLAE